MSTLYRFRIVFCGSQHAQIELALEPASTIEKVFEALKPHSSIASIPAASREAENMKAIVNGKVLKVSDTMASVKPKSEGGFLVIMIAKPKVAAAAASPAASDNSSSTTTNSSSASSTASPSTAGLSSYKDLAQSIAAAVASASGTKTGGAKDPISLAFHAFEGFASKPDSGVKPSLVKALAGISAIASRPGGLTAANPIELLGIISALAAEDPTFSAGVAAGASAIFSGAKPESAMLQVFAAMAASDPTCPPPFKAAVAAAAAASAEGQEILPSLITGMHTFVDTLEDVSPALKPEITKLGNALQRLIQNLPSGALITLASFRRYQAAQLEVHLRTMRVAVMIADEAAKEAAFFLYASESTVEGLAHGMAADSAVITLYSQLAVVQQAGFSPLSAFCGTFVAELAEAAGGETPTSLDGIPPHKVQAAWQAATSALVHSAGDELCTSPEQRVMFEHFATLPSSATVSERLDAGIAFLSLLEVSTSEEAAIKERVIHAAEAARNATTDDPLICIARASLAFGVDDPHVAAGVKAALDARCLDDSPQVAVLKGIRAASAAFGVDAGALSILTSFITTLEEGGDPMAAVGSLLGGSGAGGK